MSPLDHHLHNSPSLGSDLRALRKSRGFTLSDLAQKLGRSVGWLSQVERDKSCPTTADLNEIANMLEVPVSLLLTHEASVNDERGYIVRSDARRPIGFRVEGLSEELLSPDLTDDFEVVYSTFAPQSKSVTPALRPTQEVGYMVSGKLDLTIGGRSFSVSVGDSFRVRNEPFLWANPYNQPAVAIWVIAPPVY